MKSKENPQITTIKLSKITKTRIDKLRVYKRETYDELLQKILTILNLCRVNPEKAKLAIISLDKKKKFQ